MTKREADVLQMIEIAQSKALKEIGSYHEEITKAMQNSGSPLTNLLSWKAEKIILAEAENSLLVDVLSQLETDKAKGISIIDTLKGLKRELTNKIISFPCRHQSCSEMVNIIEAKEIEARARIVGGDRFASCDSLTGWIVYLGK